jgi:hypothetical protein
MPEERIEPAASSGIAVAWSATDSIRREIDGIGSAMRVDDAIEPVPEERIYAWSAAGRIAMAWSTVDRIGWEWMDGIGSAMRVDDAIEPVPEKRIYARSAAGTALARIRRERVKIGVRGQISGVLTTMGIDNAIEPM